MAHYFDDVFARGTGRRGSVASLRHIRRSSTARSIGARSDFETDINGTEDGRSVAVEDTERDRERTEADERLHQYINEQLEKFKEDQATDTYSHPEEYEAHAG